MALRPPTPKALPLTALRAFEAAARHGSFVLAADELGTSPAAVASHVKNLEAALNVRLFERGARGVALSAAGMRVAPSLERAFDVLGDAIQDLRDEARPRTVHVVALPAIAQLWLQPRLSAIRAALPEIRVSITALTDPPNLKRTPFDLCIFYSADGSRLCAEEVYPVCTPALAGRLRNVSDLERVECISDAAWKGDWAAWSAAAAPGTSLRLKGPVFSLYSLALEEALGGSGVLMGRHTLVRSRVRSGELVAPFPQRAPAGDDIRFWTLGKLDGRSPVSLLADWLRTESPACG